MKRIAIPIAYLLASMAVASAATPKMPTFEARRDYAGLYSYWVQVADVNGDGIPDLIGDSSGYMEVLLGNGDGTFSTGPSTLTVVGFSPSFVATDLTGNGGVDLAIVGKSGTESMPQWGVGVCLGNGDGTFQTGVFYPAGSDTEVGSLAVGDFNGDRIPDVVAVGSSGIWLFTGKGDGTLNPGVLAVALPTASGGSVAATDFNADGHLDLAVTLTNGTGTGAGFAVLMGNGDGTF